MAAQPGFQDQTGAGPSNSAGSISTGAPQAHPNGSQWPNASSLPNETLGECSASQISASMKHRRAVIYRCPPITNADLSWAANGSTSQASAPQTQADVPNFKVDSVCFLVPHVHIASESYMFITCRTTHHSPSRARVTVRASLYNPVLVSYFASYLYCMALPKLHHWPECRRRKIKCEHITARTRLREAVQKA